MFSLAGTFDTTKWDAKFSHDLTVSDPVFHPVVNFRRYILRPMNIIDLIAILPFYFLFIATSGVSLTIFRILRLGRVLRITKAGKNNSGLAILINTLKRSGDILMMMFFYILLCVVVVAALVFQFEKGTFRVTKDFPNGAYFRPTVDMQGQEVSPYVSLWATIYWSIVTGTTLGYGDLYPTTLGGRLISCFWIFCGVLILGLPISVIGSNFGIEFELHKKLEIEKKKRKKEALNNTLVLREIASYFQEPINEQTYNTNEEANHEKNIELVNREINNNYNNTNDNSNNIDNNSISNINTSDNIHDLANDIENANNQGKECKSADSSPAVNRENHNNTVPRSPFQKFQQSLTKSFASIGGPEKRSNMNNEYTNESLFQKQMDDIESNFGSSDADEVHFEDDDEDSEVDTKRRRRSHKNKDRSGRSDRGGKSEHSFEDDMGDDDDRISWGSNSKERQLQILDELRKLIESS